MYTLFFIIGVLVCSTQADSVNKNVTGRYWFEYQRKVYMIEDNFKANYFAAVQYCFQHKMQLATIQNEAEDQALLTAVKALVSGRRDFWVSGTRLADDVEWVWLTTGKPIRTFNWGEGEPTNGDEKCLSVAVLFYKNGWWNDVQCSSQLGVICETKDCN